MNRTFPILAPLLFAFAFSDLCPRAEAGLEPVKRTHSGNADYVYYRYRNTSKRPITVQLRVHNNMVYDELTKSWKTKSLKFPPFSLKAGEVKDGITFMVPRGQNAQFEEVGSRENRGEELPEYQPGSYRNPTQAERDRAARGASLPPKSQSSERTLSEPKKGSSSKFGEMLEAEFQKRLIGTWIAGPKEDHWNKNATSRIEFRANGTGTVTNHTEFKRPYGGADHWDHGFDFTYQSLGGGVWSATFSSSKTLSGDGSYGMLAQIGMKKGTFTMVDGRILRGSRAVEKNHGDYRKQ